MNWMKQNIGKTFKEAVEEWKRINSIKKDKNFKTEIAAQFEYNTYIRDFLEDNPNKTIKEARAFWRLKRETRGNKKYVKEDLFLK